MSSRSQLHVVAVLALALAAGSAPALAEYNCNPGIPIPGGTVGATFTIAAPGCYWLAGNRNMTAAGPVLNITASHVYVDLRGRTLRHALPGNTIVNGVGPLTDVHVTNGKLTGAQGGIGVSFVGNPNGVFNVSDLTITDLGGPQLPGTGIIVGGGTASSPAHAVIARNTIEVYRDGIVLDLVYGGRIEDNVLAGRPNPGTPTHGIRIGDSHGNDVRGNTISGITFGGFPIGTGILVTGTSDYNNVHDNTISGCHEGIVVDNSTCNTLDRNVAQGNLASGIRLTATSTNTVYSNNRASAGCSGVGLADLGTNVNAGGNF